MGIIFYNMEQYVNKSLVIFHNTSMILENTINRYRVEYMTSNSDRSFKQYSIKVLNGMAYGLFASLIIGLIIKQIGTYAGIDRIARFGQSAQYLMGPAIGVGVAYAIGVSPLGMIASLVTGAIGAGTVVWSLSGAVTTTALAIGEPVGALVAAMAGAEAARFIQGRTKVDIILVPFTVILIGGFVGVWIAPVVSAMMASIGSFINMLTGLYPFPMGLLLAVTMGIILTLPISSAAISISLGLSGLAAGASLVGCSCQMVGFAVASYRENGVSGLISQGIGTSMIQIPNIIRNWRIWIPAIFASAVLGPVSTVFMQMETNRVGAGMGTSGLVGQFATVEVMGTGSLWKIALMHFVLPGILALISSEFLRKKGWIAFGDMALHPEVKR